MPHCGLRDVSWIDPKWVQAGWAIVLRNPVGHGREV